MITTERNILIQESLRSLAATHAAAVRQIEATMAILVQSLELDLTDVTKLKANRPFIDTATFTVVWKGQTCCLGNSLLFALFERLAQTPNRYISHTELLEFVWSEERQTSTV